MADARAAISLYSSPISALEDGALVLTASRRLARELARRYNEKMKTSGLAAWSTPAVFFWQDWLIRQQAESSLPQPVTPLSTAASQILWERFLRRQIDDRVVGVRGLARDAAATWRLLGDWCVPLSRVVEAARSRDEQSFAMASTDYAAALDERGWIDSAAVLSAAIDVVRTGRCKIGSAVLFAGFDRLSPLVRELVAVLDEQGVDIVRQPAPYASSARRLQGFLDEEAELRAAGRWARQIALDHPGARIAIVVSDLEQDAATIGRLVREGFAPGWQLGDRPHEASVDVSYGRRLADYPAIAVALSCLSWATHGLASAEVSLLLRSRCLSAADEEAACAALERRLRRLPDRLWSAAAFADALQPRDESAPGSAFLEKVRRLAAVQLRLAERLPASAWALVIDELLGSIGWPGPASLDSEEFQLVNRWRELLNELAGLDEVLGELTLREATSRLATMAADVVFQPERGGAMIEILGPLEAAGMEFDALWVARADADRWPAANHPSSLVSRQLQLEYGMPDSSPADTLAYARRVLGRLAASAPLVHFSWSKTDLDAVRLPSPLLQELDCEADDRVTDPGWYGSLLAGTADVRAVPVDPVPPVHGEESVGGGAATIQLQRTEPFSAFAVGRLGVRELDTFAAGLNASLRGSLIHGALENLLADRPDQAAMRGWTAEERGVRIDAAVGRSLQSVERRADAVLRRLLAIERQRMALLLHAFVDAELERQPFAVVAIEERLVYRHAGVRLELRADRIDRLADGSLFIIDYKTGRVRALVDRAGEPVDLQVVVYAAAIDERTGGLSLLHLNRREIVHRAVGSAVEVKPMDDAEWQDQLNRWKAEVHGLIEAIAHGDVRVNLRGDGERRWQLNVLCRAAGEKRAD